MRCMIDCGFTYLAVCECGWRGLPCTSRVEALQEARDHEERAHWGDRDAADALLKHRTRHAAEKQYCSAPQ